MCLPCAPLPPWVRMLHTHFLEKFVLLLQGCCKKCSFLYWCIFSWNWDTQHDGVTVWFVLMMLTVDVDSFLIGWIHGSLLLLRFKLQRYKVGIITTMEILFSCFSIGHCMFSSAQIHRYRENENCFWCDWNWSIQYLQFIVGIHHRNCIKS